MTEEIDFAARWRDANGQDATRAVLRDAAHDMIRANGLEDLSMRGLAARVGASPMAAYRYYSGKDVLIDDVRVHIRSTFAAHLQEAAAAALDPTDRFCSMCRGYIDYALGNEQDYRLIFGGDVPPLVALDVHDLEYRAPAWHLLITVLDTLPDPTGQASTSDRAHLVWSTLHGVVTLHLSHQLSFGRSIRELREPAVDFLLRALQVR